MSNSTHAAALSEARTGVLIGFVMFLGAAAVAAVVDTTWIRVVALLVAVPIGLIGLAKQRFIRGVVFGDVNALIGTLAATEQYDAVVSNVAYVLALRPEWSPEDPALAVRLFVATGREDELVALGPDGLFDLLAIAQGLASMFREPPPQAVTLIVSALARLGVREGLDWLEDQIPAGLALARERLGHDVQPGRLSGETAGEFGLRAYAALASVGREADTSPLVAVGAGGGSGPGGPRRLRGRRRGKSVLLPVVLGGRMVSGAEPRSLYGLGWMDPLARVCGEVRVKEVVSPSTAQ